MCHPSLDLSHPRNAVNRSNIVVQEVIARRTGRLHPLERRSLSPGFSSVVAILVTVVGLAREGVVRAQVGSAPSAASQPPSPPPLAAHVAASAPPPSEDAADASNKAEWATRDRLVDEANSLTGSVGLLRTQHAETGAPGQFRFGFVAEWFQAGFLCTQKFACPPTPGAVAPINSDTLSHVGGTFSLGASLFAIGAGTFEGYLSTGGYANSDAANRPQVLQALGDSDLGAKYVTSIGDLVHLGLFTELWLVGGTGSVGPDGGGTSAKFGGLATLDLRALESHLPMRFSLNTVYSLDNTGDVIASAERTSGTQVTRIDRFGLGVNRVDHVDLLAGAEFFAAEERVRPFVEGKILIPYDRQGYVCDPVNSSNDRCMANDRVIPTVLTAGSRFYPWKRGFSLLAALDVGLSGTSNFVQELAPVAPWTIYLGAGWAVDTQERPPVIKMRTVEIAKAPPRGRVVGFIHEKDKNAPIVGAIVAYRDQASLTPLATGADGKFADEVPPGQYAFDIKAEGYQSGSCEANVPKGGSEVAIDCSLAALPRVGTVSGHVRDADTSQPLGSMVVTLVDAQKKELHLTTDASGGFKFDSVGPGSAELSIVTDGYLALATPVDVTARQSSSVELLLRPKPKHALVAVTATEITIKQQIQFALDSAIILPESFGLLTEIADSIIRHPELRRVEVQGHTDSSGTPDHNRTLSEQRAEAVRVWLLEHGVPYDRLVAKGYGQDKPLVPNVTAQMRARNRRVQFIIQEKDANARALPANPAGAAVEGPNAPLPGF
jgi:OmpA-OmpF porin, OOP family